MPDIDWPAVAAISGIAGAVITKGLDLLYSRYKDQRAAHSDQQRLGLEEARAQQRLLSEEARELRRQILEDLARARADIETRDRQHQEDLAFAQAEAQDCRRRHDECTARVNAQALRIDELERIVQILGASLPSAAPEPGNAA